MLCCSSVCSLPETCMRPQAALYRAKLPRCWTGSISTSKVNRFFNYDLARGRPTCTCPAAELSREPACPWAKSHLRPGVPGSHFAPSETILSCELAWLPSSWEALEEVAWQRISTSSIPLSHCSCVQIIKGFDHLTFLCSEFGSWYNGWRPHMTLEGLRPDDLYYSHKPDMPKREAKTVPGNIEHRVFAETRITAYRLKDAA